MSQFKQFTLDLEDAALFHSCARQRILCVLLASLGRFSIDTDESDLRNLIDFVLKDSIRIEEEVGSQGSITSVFRLVQLRLQPLELLEEAMRLLIFLLE